MSVKLYFEIIQKLLNGKLLNVNNIWMLTYVYLSGGYSVLMYKVIRYVIYEWALWISLLQQNDFTEKLKLWGNLTLKFHVCLSPLKIKKN